METAFLRTGGLICLPKSPRRTTAFLSSSNGLKHRALSLKTTSLSGFPLSLKNSYKFNGFTSNPGGVFQKNRSFHICRAETAAAASADGQPLFAEPEKPKIFGIETVTFKKIIPLGL
ncbi:hypothetical protein CRG98_036232, partial [Punica granatum]